MLGVKAFVHEAIHALPGPQLQRLSETLRVDLRGCDDRGDIERVLTGLLCLDQDTSLGTFIAWLRASELSALVARPAKFHNTFLPVIASNNQNSHHNGPKPQANVPENLVKDHHLDDAITQRLLELQLLEAAFKEAERVVHTGTPSYDKMKLFLVQLTRLRASEEELRRFFIKQSQVLTEQHAHMKQETLQTREQLEFFVDGFANLRQRHDALLEKALRMQAENEVAQETFLSLGASESHFAAIMANTLHKQMRENHIMQQERDAALDHVTKLQAKQRELEDQISMLKHQRGNALKDAASYKRQLRRFRAKMEHDGHDLSPECAFFRQQAVHLRQCFASMLGFVRESVLRDTKSPKQTLSKEMVKLINQTLSASSAPAASTARRKPPKKTEDKTHAQQLDDSTPAIVWKEAPEECDLDQIMTGIVLLGGTDQESAQCALAMSSKLKYSPVDVKEAMLRFQRQQQEQLYLQQQEADAQPTAKAAVGALSSASTLAPLQIESYKSQLAEHITSTMRDQRTRGFVLYNWDFSLQDVTMLKVTGLPIDSVLELQVSPPKPPVAKPGLPLKIDVKTPITAESKSRVSTATAQSKAVAKPSTPAKATPTVSASPASKSRGAAKPTSPIKSPTAKAAPASAKAPAKAAAAKSPAKDFAEKKSPAKSPSAKSSPDKSAGAKSPTVKASQAAALKSPVVPKSPTAKSPAASKTVTAPKSPAKATPTSSPIRPGSRQTTPALPKTPDSKSRTTATSQSTATPVTAKRHESRKPAVDNKAVFKPMGTAFRQIPAATFIEERVDSILDALEQQKQRKLAPFVHWDEPTRRTNELMAMFSEEVLTLLWMEQENRNPKKPPGTTSSSASSSSSRTSTAMSSATSRSGSKPPVKPTSLGKKPSASGSSSPSKSPAKGAPSPPPRRGTAATTAAKPAPPASPKSRSASVSPAKRK